MANPHSPPVPESATGADGPVTVVTVIRQRIEQRHQCDQTWYLLNRFVPLLEHFDRLQRENGDRYHTFQWALILASSLTAFFVAAEALTSDPWTTLLKVGGLLTALLVIALTSLMHAFGYLNKSLAYRDIKEKLVAEFFAMDAGLGAYTNLSDDQRLRRFEEGVESLVAGVDVRWPALQAPSGSGGTVG